MTDLSWEDFCRELESVFEVMRDNGDHITVLINVDDARKQLVNVAHFEVDPDMSVVMFSTPVARVDEADGDTVLAAVMDLPITVSRTGQFYTAAILHPLNALRAGSAHSAVKLLALAADTLEARLSPIDRF